MAKGKKKGKTRQAEAVDNIEYATLRAAGELTDIQHLLNEMLDELREIREQLKQNVTH